MKPYFITREKGKPVVWGSGTTRKASMKDARGWTTARGHTQCPIKLRTIPCDYSLFTYVQVKGGNNVPFRIKNGVAYLDCVKLFV